jgi:acyl-coenzyme A thioesterase PaaI-like protein
VSDLSCGGATAQRLKNALSVPLLRFLDVSAVDPQDPRAGVLMAPSPNVMNAVNAPHAGALSTILEIAAYLALLPDLSPEEEAVSHALFVSYLARADGTLPLVASGQLLRRTRRVAFVTVELRQDGVLLATAQVTKSIYPLGPA